MAVKVLLSGYMPSRCSDDPLHTIAHQIAALAPERLDYKIKTVVSL
jgi:hypothetical protein